MVGCIVFHGFRIGVIPVRSQHDGSLMLPIKNPAPELLGNCYRSAALSRGYGALSRRRRDYRRRTDAP